MLGHSLIGICSCDNELPDSTWIYSSSMAHDMIGLYICEVTASVSGVIFLSVIVIISLLIKMVQESKKYMAYYHIIIILFDLIKAFLFCDFIKLVIPT